MLFNSCLSGIPSPSHLLWVCLHMSEYVWQRLLDCETKLAALTVWSGPPRSTLWWWLREMDEHVGFGAVLPVSEMRPDTLPTLLPLGVSHAELGVGASAGRIPVRRPAESALYCWLKCSVVGRGFPLPVTCKRVRWLKKGAVPQARRCHNLWDLLLFHVGDVGSLTFGWEWVACCL